MHSEDKGECLLAYKEGKVAWLDINSTGGLLDTKATRRLKYITK